jgi:hypothetical protein
MALWKLAIMAPSGIAGADIVAKHGDFLRTLDPVMGENEVQRVKR